MSEKAVSRHSSLFALHLARRKGLRQGSRSGEKPSTANQLSVLPGQELHDLLLKPHRRSKSRGTNTGQSSPHGELIDSP